MPSFRTGSPSCLLSQQILKTARPCAWRSVRRRSWRSRWWTVGALSVILAVELTVLVVAGGRASREDNSRMGPLEPPREGRHRFSLLDAGSEPLPRIVRRLGEVPANVLAGAPDLLDHYERIPWGLPVSLERGWVSSEFSMNRVHPVTGKRRPHYGIDLAVDGGTPVLATAKGVVVFSGWKNGYGNVIYLDHENGMTTRYAHLERLVVKRGQHVNRGELIGLSGATGQVTGEHLHYEVRIDGEAVNPRAYLPADMPTTRPPGM